MKKFSLLFLIIVLLFIITSCGKTNDLDTSRSFIDVKEYNLLHDYVFHYMLKK